MKESKSLVDTYSNQIQHLENALLAHDEETQATDALVDKIKSLHAEHCSELEREISKLQRINEEKANLLCELEGKYQTLSNEKLALETSAKEFSDYLKKMEELGDEKKLVINTYEEKLQVS